MLVTANVIGEASRIGFGSALATIMLVISLVFVIIFLSTVMRGSDDEQRHRHPHTRDPGDGRQGEGGGASPSGGSCSTSSSP